MKQLAVLALLLNCTAPGLAQSTGAVPSPTNRKIDSSVINRLVNSKHDFSARSNSDIRAATRNEMCVFCHTPHRANPAAGLWNQKESTGYTYQVYQSSTMASTVSQPLATDTSKLCLSCHDGTVALGDTVNDGLIPMRDLPGDQKLPPSNSGNLAGAGLSVADSHPFAFAPNLANKQVQLPSPGDLVTLDQKGRIQCTSCHDPHNETVDPVEGRFLVKRNSSSAICASCHNLRGGSGVNLWSWNGSQGQPSAHEGSAAIYNGGTNAGIAWLGAHTGYTTTATNGCESCHRPHAAHDSARLLKGETDQVCFQCHDGNVVTRLPDLESEITRKVYSHPSVGPQPGHDPDEAPNNILARHAACDDCHNSHAARADSQTLLPPRLSGALLGESGIGADGTVRDPHRGGTDALYEYEICLKCHSYNLNQPQVPGYSRYGPLPYRQIRSIDLRQALTSAASFHPVTTARGLSAGPGGAVPSLLRTVVDANGSPIPGRTLSGSSQIYCTDCHSNDTGRNLGGSYKGPAGPHGSNVIHLLERNYVIEVPAGGSGNTPGIPYASSTYELCFKCHSEQSLRNNESFKLHSQHMAITSCATCHDPHGVPNGTAAHNGSLINFDLNVVAPSSTGAGPQWTDLTPAPGSTVFKGSCTLRCHGQNHNNLGY
ncbi:MAG: cytochrome c3 family protein [Terriglobia bacterium]